MHHRQLTPLLMLLLPRSLSGLSVSTGALHRGAAPVGRPAALCSYASHRAAASRVRLSTTLEPAAAASAAGDAALPRSKVSKLLAQGSATIGDTVLLKGWVRTVRDLKNFSFVELNDGSSLAGMQIIANSDLGTYDVVGQLSTGAACAVVGEVVASKGSGQEIEVKATSLELVGGCPADTYPLQKKRHSLEFLRSIAHLRPRSNLFGAVSRVRSSLAQATHSFFASEGFKYVQTPLLTASDCEGAGEMFQQSNTARHLAEFWMIEPEMAFADLEADMGNAEAYVKYVVSHVMEHCAEDLAFFNSFVDKGLLGRLEKLVSQPFARVSYSEAVELLQAEIAKDPSKWEFPDVEFGTDLSTEHERWLAEKKFETATFVYDYPKSIKAFYMRDNDGCAPGKETVAAMDLLVPGVGELIGGSQREERLDKLIEKMGEVGLEPEDYWWYLDLRRYGTVPHAGYGLGFERLVCYVTGVANIRDAIAFPRYPGSCEF